MVGVVGIVNAALLVALIVVSREDAAAGPAPLPGGFELVGHSPLMERGMNSALAIHRDHAYVGSRTDGTHPNAGVLTVDISDPASPRVVDQIGPPNEAVPGESSRELRVWAAADLLVVMNFKCDPGHSCPQSDTARSTLRFYDIAGANEAHPQLVSTYEIPRVPHEFFLWEDPKRPGRALAYITVQSETEDNLLVVDVSGAREGRFAQAASFTAPVPDREFGQLHSLSVSPDGTRAFFAYLSAGYMEADTSDLAAARPNPQVRLVTPVEQRVEWGIPGAHSAVKLHGRDYVLMTDEVYGAVFGQGEALGYAVLKGCPWGWVRVVDISDRARPKVASEFKLRPYNDPSYCGNTPPLQNDLASYSSHNPTLLPNMALITWHSAGLEAVSLADPRTPTQLAEFRPKPLDRVATEDPALSSGNDKVVFWSYPIVKDGLIYVVDIRNGLYVLRYRGPREREVECVDFIEGNSTRGDAAAPCERMTIRQRRARVTGARRVRVSVSCRASERTGCRGRLRLASSGRPRTVGLATFDIPAGTRRKISVPLNRRGVRRVDRRRRLRVSAVAHPRLAVAARARLVLLAPRASR